MSRRVLSLLLLFMACTACGADAEKRQRAHQDAQARAIQPAIAQDKQVIVQANAMMTTALNPMVAQHYGITPDPSTVFILINLRPNATTKTPASALINATASSLLGKKTAIQLREIRNEEWIDYVGTVRIAPPETLRFDIRASYREQGEPITLIFNRDFLPQSSTSSP